MSFFQKPSLTLQKFRDFILQPTHKRTLGIVIILVLAATVSLTVVLSQQQQTIRQHAAGDPISPSFPPITPEKITSCGNINKSGNYIMDADIIATGNGCLNVENVNNIDIDCRGHSIILDQNALPTNVDQFRPLLGITDVKNFSVKSCALRVINVSGSPAPITISKSSNGVISGSTFYDPSAMSNRTGLDYFYVIFDHVSNVVFRKNTVYAVYQQHYSDNVVIEDNNFYPALETLKTIAIVVSLDNGNHNLIQNNTIDGKWDGVMRGNYSLNVGADDGIVLTDESDDVIKENKIQNNWDCGIETIGLIKDTKITTNTIAKSGICGIGAWYYNSWKNNIVADNVVDSAPKMFDFFRADGLRDGEDYVYFTDNIFINNGFLNPTGNVSSRFIFSKHVTARNKKDKDVTEESYIVKNNTFSKNDFNSKLPAPLFAPTSMVVDGAGNICGVPTREDYSNVTDFPLRCVGQIILPQPHTTRGKSYVICGRGLKCENNIRVGTDDKEGFNKCLSNRSFSKADVINGKYLTSCNSDLYYEDINNSNICSLVPGNNPSETTCTPPQSLTSEDYAFCGSGLKCNGTTVDATDCEEAGKAKCLSTTANFSRDQITGRSLACCNATKYDLINNNCTLTLAADAQFSDPKCSIPIAAGISKSIINNSDSIMTGGNLKYSFTGFQSGETLEVWVNRRGESGIDNRTGGIVNPTAGGDGSGASTIFGLTEPAGSYTLKTRGTSSGRSAEANFNIVDSTSTPTILPGSLPDSVSAE